MPTPGATLPLSQNWKCSETRKIQANPSLPSSFNQVRTIRPHAVLCGRIGSRRKSHRQSRLFHPVRQLVLPLMVVLHRYRSRLNVILGSVGSLQFPVEDKMSLERNLLLPTWRQRKRSGGASNIVFTPRKLYLPSKLRAHFTEGRSN